MLLISTLHLRECLKIWNLLSLSKYSQRMFQIVGFQLSMTQIIMVNLRSQHLEDEHLRKIKSRIDKISTAVKYRSAVTIQRVYRGHLARKIYWESIWERLTKLRAHRLLIKRIKNMEETVNKLAYESQSTADAVNWISKAWKTHRLNSVILSRIEQKKKNK